MVILMSPQDVPAAFQDMQHHGSLFTLFLHSPLTALCYVCSVGDVPIHHWERCQGYVDRFITEASRLVTRCRIDEIEQNIGFIGEWRVGWSFFRPISNSFASSRFIVRSILRWWFPANPHPAIRILRCCTALASIVPRKTPTAEMRTSTACCRVAWASLVVAYCPAVGHGSRCPWSLFGGHWSRLILWLGNNDISSYFISHDY